MNNKSSRRMFLKTGSAAIATGALTAVAGCGNKKKVQAKKSVRYGMVIDLKKCVGCGACTVACKAENHTPPGVAYNIVMEEEVGTFPNVRRRFLPRPCMQCRNSSCVLVCPTGATYHRDDGIVAVDYDKCIGCRYCVTACPYGARSFDFGDEYGNRSTSFDTMPSPEYAEYRKRKKGKSPIGNVRKCTFCIHRVKKGLLPACVSTCIGKAMYFGDLNDRDSEINKLIVKRNHMRLKEELGNEPSVYYLL